MRFIQFIRMDKKFWFSHFGFEPMGEADVGYIMEILPAEAPDDAATASYWPSGARLVLTGYILPDERKIELGTYAPTWPLG